MTRGLRLFVPKPDDSLLAIPSELTLRSPENERNFVGQVIRS